MNHVLRCTAACIFLLWVCVLLTAMNAEAQSMPREDLRSGLLATTADTNVASSINPAATGFDGYSSVRLWIYEPYGISEIKTQGAGLSLAVGSTGFGFSIQSVNYDRLRLVRGNLVLSREIMRSAESLVQFGLRLQTEHARFSSQLLTESGYAASGVQFGILIKVVPGIVLGSVLGTWFVASSRSASSVRFDAGMGIGIQLSERARVLSDIRRVKFFGTDVRVGMEFSPVHVIRLQGGLASNPERFTIGITFSLRRIHIHFVVDRHNLLGSSRAAEMEMEI